MTVWTEADVQLGMSRWTGRIEDGAFLVVFVDLNAAGRWAWGQEGIGARLEGDREVPPRVLAALDVLLGTSVEDEHSLRVRLAFAGRAQPPRQAWLRVEPIGERWGSKCMVAFTEARGRRRYRRRVAGYRPEDITDGRWLPATVLGQDERNALVRLPFDQEFVVPRSALRDP